MAKTMRAKRLSLAACTARARFLTAVYHANSRIQRFGIAEARALKPLKRVAKALFWGAAGWDGRFMLAQVRGRPMWIPNEPYFISAYVAGEYEPFTTALFLQSVPKNGVVLDVGANVGFFTLLAAEAVGPQGHVFAFEAAPDNARALKRNVEMNGYANVSSLAKAAGDTREVRTLRLASCTSCHSFFPHPQFPSHGTASVESVPIDSVVHSPTVHVAKIDVEGAEVAALQGMRRVLDRSRGIRLFVEMHPACLKAAGSDARHLVSLLTAWGFSLNVIDEGASRLLPLDENLTGVPLDDPTYYANLYCSRADDGRQQKGS